MSTIEGGDISRWDYDPSRHNKDEAKKIREHEAREVSDTLDLVLRGKDFLLDAATREKVPGMSISKKIELLRQLYQDPRVTGEDHDNIEALLKTVDRNKFEHE